jgi:hypothetical protein
MKLTHARIVTDNVPALARLDFVSRNILIPLLARNVRAEKERGKTLLLASDLDYVNVRTGAATQFGGSASIP